MPFLIEILLPVTINTSRAAIDAVRGVLVSQFGGATLHINAPAEGLWAENGEVDRDGIVVCEVMVNEIDDEWWQTYRRELEDSFDQKEILIRSTQIMRL